MERLVGICKKIQDKEGFITVTNFAKHANKSISGTRKCFYRLLEKDLIEKIGGGERTYDKRRHLKGMTEFRYKLKKR